MFVSTLSTMDGFKLTLPNGEEVDINLIRTLSFNVATISIDCPDDILIEKTESTIDTLERVRQDLLSDIDRLQSEKSRLYRKKNGTNEKVTYKKKRGSNQPYNNKSKKFPSGEY